MATTNPAENLTDYEEADEMPSGGQVDPTQAREIGQGIFAENNFLALSDLQATHSPIM